MKVTNKSKAIVFLLGLSSSLVTFGNYTQAINDHQLHVYIHTLQKLSACRDKKAFNKCTIDEKCYTQFGWGREMCIALCSQSYC